jgi:hypothetical protein
MLKETPGHPGRVVKISPYSIIPPCESHSLWRALSVPRHGIEASSLKKNVRDGETCLSGESLSTLPDRESNPDLQGENLIS